MFKGMFKTANNKRFDYLPRSYDPIMEDLKERVESREITEIDNREARRMRISRGISRNQGRSKIRSESTFRANSVIVLLIVILGMMAYLVFEFI